MGKYLPYSGNHSIQETIIAIRFQKMVDEQEVEYAKDLVQTSLKEDFPQLKALHQVQTINVGQVQNEATLQHTQGPSRLGGFEFMRVRPDARPSCVLNFSNDTFSINFLEYSNWEITLTESLKYLKTVLPAINLAGNPIVGCVLKYVDRYTFDGSPDEASAGLLLQSDSKFVTRHCFDSGPTWHCHSGWFDLWEEVRILNQLEVGSTIVDQIPTIILDHNSVCHLRMPRQSIDSLFHPSSDTEKGIEDILERMHACNKSVLKDVLLSEVLNDIGIQS